MTLLLLNWRGSERGDGIRVTHMMRRAKKEKMDAFLAIDVRILEIMISGKAMSTVSVTMLVASR